MRSVRCLLAVLCHGIRRLILITRHRQPTVPHHVVEELSGCELALLLLKVDLVLKRAQLVHGSLRVKLLLLGLVLQTSKHAVLDLRRINVSVACTCHDLEGRRILECDLAWAKVVLLQERIRFRLRVVV